MAGTPVGLNSLRAVGDFSVGSARFGDIRAARLLPRRTERIALLTNLRRASNDTQAAHANASELASNRAKLLLSPHARTHDLCHQAKLLEQPNSHPSDVEFPPFVAVRGGPLIGVVVVVPAFAIRQ